MITSDNWSRIIEGSHALFCGFFALLALIGRIYKKKRYYLIMSSVAMGCQLMNSVLYMFNYFIEMKDKNNINFVNSSFPLGEAFSERPFMWVNLIWTVMPTWVILSSIYYEKKPFVKDFKALD